MPGSGELLAIAAVASEHGNIGKLSTISNRAALASTGKLLAHHWPFLPGVVPFPRLLSVRNSLCGSRVMLGFSARNTKRCRGMAEVADPFQDVDAAGEEFISAFADSMDERQSDPTMEKIVSRYLGKIEFGDDSLTVEVGCGAGAVTRRIAEKANPGRVIGFEPSKGFVNEARARVGAYDNVSFEVAGGASLPLDDGAVDNLILHTVLTHVTDPELLLTEAMRVIRPGGRLVVCDADFSKASLGNLPNDPLDSCAKIFVKEFVTDPYVVAKLQMLALNAGFEIEDFSFQSRSVLDNDQMLPWVEETGKVLMMRGEIGEDLHKGLIAEYRRRAKEGTLYGYQVFATLIAQRP